MDIAVAAKELMNSNRGKFLLSGALLGIYINVLHAIPFMLASELFILFALIAFSAFIIPVTAHVWGLKEQNPNQKVQQLIRGITLTSAVFTAIYLLELIISHYTSEMFTAPIQFTISRSPHISLLISIALLGIFVITGKIVKREQKQKINVNNS